MNSTGAVPSKRQRVLLVASGGGHWVQLLRLRPAFEGHDCHFVTVAPGYRGDIGDAPFHCVVDATRWERLRMLRLAVRMLWLILRIRPDVVVATGAAPGYFAVRFGGWVGARSIWVDSMANVDRLSMAGELAGRYASLWLTQWPHLASDDGPEYRGTVL